MAESKPPTGLDQSTSQKVMDKMRDSSPSPSRNSKMKRNPSQKEEQSSPLQLDKQASQAEGSVKRNSKAGSEAGSGSPTKAKSNAKQPNRQARVANRQQELQQKGLISGDFKGLSTDYPSFELLWFDIESKTRHLIQELIDPIVDRLVDHQDNINQVRQDHTKTEEKVENLKDTIFQTNGKLDVFEQINLKLANLEAERKILEAKVDYENKIITSKMEEIDQRAEIQTKVFKNLQSHTQDVMKELSELKVTYAQQCDLFVGEVNNCNKLIIDHSERLTDYCQRLEKTTVTHKGRLDLNDSQIQELYSRMKAAEEAILLLEKETLRLEAEKTDKTLFYKTKKKLDLKDLEQDIKLFKNTNHCITLDNYLEKYLPIRTQSLINETLRSILGGKERRRLELYDNEKNAILYQQLLSDDGGGAIAGLMRDLHEKASIEIEEEDKRRKRRLAITEASNSQDQLANEGSASHVSMPQNLTGAQNSATGIQEGMQSADNMQMQSKMGLIEPAPEVHFPGTSGPIDSSYGIAGVQSAQNINPALSAAALPSIISDENVYRLTDLINADFKMPITDKDFELTHEQVIKVCKIILYKFNLASKKNMYERQELTAMINDRITQIEALTKTSLEEVNTFLHTVHQDFESFLNKHKKEHTNLNMRVLKVTEDMGSVVTQIGPIKAAVENYATVITCLVEFNSIEQALAVQDESDRKNMQLLGGTNRLKIPEINIGSENSIFGAPSKENTSISSQFTARKGPIKAKRMNSNPGSARARNLLQSNFRTVNERADAQHIMNSLSVESVDNRAGSIKHGPVQVDKDCLSCAGVPSHTMDLFKMACIQYQPSPVTYRSNNLTRNKLLSMRKTLVDKCEEVINLNMYPHSTQDLRTGKIFKDLLQFYGTVDQSIYSDGSGNFHDHTTMPQSNASFMPAISQRTLQQNSLDDNPQINSGAILNHDLMSPVTHHRKHSHPNQPLPNGSFMPMGKGIQGSGATLNNPNMGKRNNNNNAMNSVTVKAGLDGLNQGSPHMIGNTETQINAGGYRDDTPGEDRDSQAHTPPRAENTLTPIHRGSSKKQYHTKLPQI